MSDDIKKYVLRIPNDLKVILENDAKNEGCSLNSKIIKILAETVGFNDDYNSYGRVITSGSTYRTLEIIREYLKDKIDILRVTLAVRNGSSNKSALTIIFYTSNGSVIFDTTNLTAERTPREYEVYAFVDALDSLGVFNTTRYIAERVFDTEHLEAEEAIQQLEKLPTEPIANFNIYKFLSLFCYTDNKSQIPPSIFMDEWKVLCNLQ